MLKKAQSLQLSASDLVGHLHCRHLTNLELEVVAGSRDRPRFLHDSSLETLWERGAIHERAYLEHLANAGHEIARIDGVGVTPEAIETTLAAMRAGVSIIAQAALSDGWWTGRADVLRRVSRPSTLGEWSYEVIDTKLARETRGSTVLQLCLYADLLASVQGYPPERVYVVTPGEGFPSHPFRTAAYAAYYRYVKHSLKGALDPAVGTATYPDPTDYCEICRWRAECDGRRRTDDHLYLVASISRIQIAELCRNGTTTTAALATMPVPLAWKPQRGVRQSYERLREQARVQVKARTANQPVYETIAPLAGSGLARLPEPSPGDIFFDIEGDPFVGEGGLEFLFGYVYLGPNTERVYVGEWAFNRDEERHTFERFVDFVMARWSEHPTMHIYHYAAYEPGALKRLMGRYATREDEIDRMLRGGLFVDLYTVVRQGIRAGIESYTIKNLESFYRYSRAVPLTTVRPALTNLQADLELGAVGNIDEEDKLIVKNYNRDDCLSTLELHDWLESVRTELVAQGAVIERPHPEPAEPTDQISERQRQVAALVGQLSHDVPSNVEARTPEQHARWILANTLDWHRRELKSVWWEYFRLSDLTVDDLLDENAALSGLEYVEDAGGTKRAPIQRYRFPPQDTELRAGDKLCMEGGANLGKVDAIS